MKKTINEYQFSDAFVEMGRENNFSYEGRKALFDYLEQYEEETGLEMELDVIALCCEFTEYENIEEFNNNYGKECETLDEVAEYTQVININDESFIIQDF